MIPYFPGGEEEGSHFTRNSGKKFMPVCPNCGRLSERLISPNDLDRLKGISCICGDGVTIPNKIIRELADQALEMGLISYKRKEYPSVDSKGIARRFDMFIEDLNGNPYLIEMDGGYHGDIKKKHSPKEMVFVSAKQLLADYMKEQIAESLGLPLIRVDCYKSDVKYIKNSLYNSDVAKIINLDLIDWDKIARVCSSSLMADICKYKAEHKDATATEVAELFDVTPSTVRNYWHNGTELGMCEYDSQAEGKRWMHTKKEWKQGVPILLENLSTGKQWNYMTIKEFIYNAESIFSSKFTERMFERRFEKTDNNYIIYESPETGESFRITRVEKEEK